MLTNVCRVVTDIESKSSADKTTHNRDTSNLNPCSNCLGKMWLIDYAFSGDIKELE
jgi:hypothetical protein